MIRREILKTLEKEFDKKHITALIGARQVGKSTILNELYKKVEKKAIYLRFDRVDVLNLFDNDIESFIIQYIKPYEYIFIDEIQYSQKSGKYLKYIVDEFNKKIFITGSSSPDLSIKTLSYLVGRIRIFEIYGISFREFIYYKDKIKLPLIENNMATQFSLKQFKSLFSEYLTYGSYPGVIIENDYDEKKLILKDIINTYLLKEIREILNFENSFQFELLLKRLSLSNGSILNYSNISSDIDVKSKKVKEMINILNKTYVISLLNPFLNNKIKELIKSPKTYFLDMGFKNGLTNNFSELDFRLDKGFIYESFVLKEIILNGFKVNFWNYKNEYEMDFVIEKDTCIYGIEIKSKLLNANITTSMKKFIEYYNPKTIYVLNENIDETTTYNKTKILFTNYLNLNYILSNIKSN